MSQQFTMQQLVLEVLSGAAAGRKVAIVPPGGMIGRDPISAVHLPDKKVSSYHAELSCEKGQWTLQDANSMNGTFLNEQPVGVEPAALGESGVIRVGNVNLRFSVVSLDRSMADGRQEASRPLVPETLVVDRRKDAFIKGGKKQPDNVTTLPDYLRRPQNEPWADLGEDGGPFSSEVRNLHDMARDGALTGLLSSDSEISRLDADGQRAKPGTGAPIVSPGSSGSAPNHPGGLRSGGVAGGQPGGGPRSGGVAGGQQGGPPSGGVAGGPPGGPRSGGVAGGPPGGPRSGGVAGGQQGGRRSGGSGGPAEATPGTGPQASSLGPTRQPTVRSTERYDLSAMPAAGAPGVPAASKGMDLEASIRRELAQLQQQYEILSRHYKALSGQYEEVEAENTGLKARNEQQVQVIRALKSESEQQAQMIRALKAESEQQVQAIQGLRSENERQVQAIYGLQAEHGAQVQAIDALKAALEKAQAEAARTRHEYAESGHNEGTPGADGRAGTAGGVTGTGGGGTGTSDGGTGTAGGATATRDRAAVAAEKPSETNTSTASTAAREVFDKSLDYLKEYCDQLDSLSDAVSSGAGPEKALEVVDDLSMTVADLRLLLEYGRGQV